MDPPSPPTPDHAPGPGPHPPGPSPSAPAPPPPLSPSHYEQAHVHEVYDTIAPHFSSTRHKPWPLVTSFLASLPPGSLVLDVGCGNGKYLLPSTTTATAAAVEEEGDGCATGAAPPPPPARHHYFLGSDRSAALVRLARDRTGADVLVADSLALPFRARCADAVICVAVVHHFSTTARRREAVAALLGCAREGGEVLVYAWALEQGASRRGWGEGDEQDRLVPWVMKGKGGAADETYQRYYHLYREGELEGDVRAVGGRVLRSGYERDNWWVVCTI